MANFNSIYLFYVFIGLSAAMFAEGVYLLVYSNASYRKKINRRLKVMSDKTDRESVLVQLRRERGLTSGGDYRLPVVNLNQLLLQSGLSIGLGLLALLILLGMVAMFAAVLFFHGTLTQATIATLVGGVALPPLVLRILRNRRQKKFSAQFPNAIDMIVRSLRAGHPVPIAITMVGKEMPDPIGSEFGIVSDEMTYGSDLETAMRNLYFRVGIDDLPLFVTAVAIQRSTGGNLGEILENLSSVIRDRFKMRRKIRALAAEGRASALILSSLPIGMFAVIHFLVPSFCKRLGSEPDENRSHPRRLLDERRQFHHVPHGQLQDLTMDTVVTVFGNMLQDGNTMVMGLLVFLAAGTLAFSVMAAIRVRGSVKRRTERILTDEERKANHSRSLQHSSQKTVASLIEYTTKHYGSANDENMKVLRRRLVQAGIYDPRGVAFFFIARTALAVGLAAAIFMLLPLVRSSGGTFLWLMVIAGGVAGYVGPSMYIDKRISARKLEHRSGFPDFMDLLVVCADSGLSMEASFERVSRELGPSYPSLTANIHLTNLEIRAGRPLKEALEHFADRLALEESRAFATLINQSIDLGSSITDAMRVYSDDMRHKRLSMAEEKAYALPAKLAVPMMVCIFPVLFVVILLPVIVRLHMNGYF
ncbi:MAG: type II secretion system F family protein [Pseudolabrys sp.]